MSNVLRRVENWQAKFSPEDTARILTRKEKLMRERYTAAMAPLCLLEDKAKQVLNASGIQTILYLSYINYARQLYKLSRQQGISGNSFAMAAEVLLDKWQNRGLDPVVLAAIRKDVFDVPNPTPPEE